MTPINTRAVRKIHSFEIYEYNAHRAFGKCQLTRGYQRHCFLHEAKTSNNLVMENYTSDSSDMNSTFTTSSRAYCGILQLPDLNCSPDNEMLDKRLLNIENPGEVNNLWLCRNRFTTLPASISRFASLNYLCISNCGLTTLPDFWEDCVLTRLIAKGNNLANDGLAKNFKNLTYLWELDLSGNRLTEFPDQVLDVPGLRYLNLGSNSISKISKDIWKLQRLRVLLMGANKLTEVPSTLGQLKELQALDLCNNMLESLPSWIANLTKLVDLLLDNNKLRTLPIEIITLNCLLKLSVQNNPLVVRFVPNMTHDPPSLLELAARIIKTSDIRYDKILPHNLVQYLNSAHRCANPNCKV